MRTVIYVLSYLLLMQAFLPRVVPERWVYQHRVEYHVVRNNMPLGIRRAVQVVADDIRATQPADYVILLGDSVMYSGPGEAYQSIGVYLEQWAQAQGRSLKVYNLGQPAMQPGDLYTILLLLKEQGVPLRRVVINLIYFGFVERTPDQPVVSWLGYELQRLDPETFGQLADNLSKRFPPKRLTSQVTEQVLNQLAIWRYRDIFVAKGRELLGLPIVGEVRDVRPWAQKLFLPELMKEPIYQRMVDPRPFDLSSANPNVLMLEKIIQETQGAQVFFFFAPLNQELMAPWVGNPTYRENLRRVDQWFAAKPVDYVNWENAMPADRFTDHIHLLPGGYQELAGWIGERLFPPSS